MSQSKRIPPPVLSATALAEALESLPGWEILGGKLYRQFVFRNFIEAFGFMTQSAIIAERDNHHPEWSNVYKTVSVALVTHESDGITERDLSLARAMNRIAD